MLVLPSRGLLWSIGSLALEGLAMTTCSSERLYTARPHAEPDGGLPGSASALSLGRRAQLWVTPA